MKTKYIEVETRLSQEESDKVRSLAALWKTTTDRAVRRIVREFKPAKKTEAKQ
jgi:hypothetical protein